MGADGGTIPRRDELVKEKKKPEKKDKTSEQKHKWNDCAISQLPLQQPVLSCEYGNLYNKESVIEFLLEKKDLDKFSHLRGLKDVKELNLTDNPALSREDDKMDISDASKYVCPVTGLEMSGKHRFCFIWDCGCVMSERALKEVPSKSCHKCGKEYNSDNIIILNGDDADFEKMKSNMLARRQAAKLAKKSRKRPAAEAGETTSKEKKISKTDKKAEQNGASKVKTKQDKSKTKSVQEDPAASDTYKSLFTTCDEAKKQGKQHSGWVSCNPQYFR